MIIPRYICMRGTKACYTNSPLQSNTTHRRDVIIFLAMFARTFGRAASALAGVAVRTPLWACTSRVPTVATCGWTPTASLHPFFSPKSEENPARPHPWLLVFSGVALAAFTGHGTINPVLCAPKKAPKEKDADQVDFLFVSVAYGSFDHSFLNML